MLDQDDRAAAAQALGMKPSEITNVTLTAAGTVITTHDGQHSLVRADGSITSPYTPEIGELGPELLWSDTVAAPIPLPEVGAVFTAEHARALQDWLLDQGYAPAHSEHRPAATAAVELGDGEIIDVGAGELVDTAAADEQADPAADEVDDEADQLPGGSVAEVLAWVGEDRAKAAQALAAESVAEKPRATLVRQLEALAGGQA